jgi:lipopolysaccharide transport system permease protein
VHVLKDRIQICRILLRPGRWPGVWRNRGLITAMVKPEVIGRYRGLIMELAWSFFNPLLIMLVIYTFVFSVVFKARWGVEGEESKTYFAIILFVGTIHYHEYLELL